MADAVKSTSEAFLKLLALVSGLPGVDIVIGTKDLVMETFQKNPSKLKFISAKEMPVHVFVGTSRPDWELFSTLSKNGLVSELETGEIPKTALKGGDAGTLAKLVLEDGLTVAAAAQKMGLSMWTAYRLSAELKLSERKKGNETKSNTVQKAHKRNEWTKEDLETLESLIKEGKSYKDIARALGRSHAAVMQRASITKKNKDYCNKPNSKPWTSGDLRTLIGMRTRGKDWKEIALALSRTEDAVKTKIYKINNRQA